MARKFKSMRRELFVLVIGLTLVLIAIILFGALHLTGSENTHTLIISPGGVRVYNFTAINGDILIISSESNFSYSLYESTGNLVNHSNNVSSAEIHLSQGTYKLYLKNNGEYQLRVSVAIVENDQLQRFMFFTYASSTICALGVVISIVGFALILWHRKKEEKIYTRY